MLVDSLNKANDDKWVAQEALVHLREDLHQFRQPCETLKARAVALPADDRPVAGRHAARLLRAGLMPWDLLQHLCDAWLVQHWEP